MVGGGRVTLGPIKVVKLVLSLGAKLLLSSRVLSLKELGSPAVSTAFSDKST